MNPPASSDLNPRPSSRVALSYEARWRRAGWLPGSLLASGPALAAFVDPLAVHQTGDDLKTGELTLQPVDASSRALVLKATAAQEEDLFQVQREDGEVEAAWGATGGLTLFGGDADNPRPFEVWVDGTASRSPQAPACT